jgi:hypothetical protein
MDIIVKQARNHVNGGADGVVAWTIAGNYLERAA